MAYSTIPKNPSDIGTEVYNSAYYISDGKASYNFTSTGIIHVADSANSELLAGTELISLREGELWFRAVAPSDNLAVGGFRHASVGWIPCDTVEEGLAKAAGQWTNTVHRVTHTVERPGSTVYYVRRRFVWGQSSTSPDFNGLADTDPFARIVFNEPHETTGVPSWGFYTKANLNDAWTRRFQMPHANLNVSPTGILVVGLGGFGGTPAMSLTKVNGDKASIGPAPVPIPPPPVDLPDSVVVVPEPDVRPDIRLEIEQQDTPDNVIDNPDGEDGTGGWSREGTNFLFTWDNNKSKFKIQGLQGSGSARGIYSGIKGVKPGQKVTAKLWQVDTVDTSLGSLRIAVEFINQAGSVVSRYRSDWTPQNFTGSLTTPTGTAPATAVEARMHIAFGYYAFSNSTSVTEGGKNGLQVWFNQADMRIANTDPATTMTAFVPSVSYRNILNNTSDVSIKRGELEVGILNATVHDATLDPSQLAAIRPGRRVRFRALNGATWETVFQGKLAQAQVEYNPVTNEPTVRLTATDAVTTLTSTPAPFAPVSLDYTKAFLEDTGASFSVNGTPFNDTNVTDETIDRSIARYEEENLTALEALAITRDTNKGYVWVNRKGVITVYDANQLPPMTQPRALSDVAGDVVEYSHIDVGFDTSNLINVLNITTVETVDVEKEVFFTRADGTQESFLANVPEKREVRYLFDDRGSVHEWGARSLNVTLLAPIVQTVDANGTPATYSYSVKDWAAAVLATKAFPRVQVREVAFPVKDANSTHMASTTDLFSLVPVVYKDRINASYRVTSIEHTITPTKWVVTLGFNRRVDSALW